MNWFPGSISEAISKSQLEKLVFLVYIQDTEEISTETSEYWNDSEVAKRCSENCVSIRLEANSEECDQFKQIYPIVCYPTTYLIGNLAGTPLRIISGKVEKEDFISRLDNAFEIHREQKAGLQSSASAVDVQVSDGNQVDEESKKKAMLEEKVAQAKEKLRLIQQKKRQEDEEAERARELERRRMGQEVLQAKKDKEDAEMKRIADEKRREKLADEQAKQRVLEKIREDREAKQKKYNTQKDESEKAKETLRVERELERQKERLIEEANKGKIARIQFRFTDGASTSNQFEPELTLEDVKNFVIKKLIEMGQATSFTMHSTFPKRDYTQEDMARTLRDLQLVPTATLLIIPTRSAAAKKINQFIPNISNASSDNQRTVASYASDFLSLVLLPVTIIWGIFSSIFGLGNNTTQQQSQQQQPRTTHNDIEQDRVNLRLRRFRGVNDDDDKTTYNGNSTQQL